MVSADLMEVEVFQLRVVLHVLRKPESLLHFGRLDFAVVLVDDELQEVYSVLFEDVRHFEAVVLLQDEVAWLETVYSSG